MTNTISTDTISTIREALDELGETGSHRVWRGDLQTCIEENAGWLFVCAWPEQIGALRTEAGSHGDLGMVRACDEAAHDADALRSVLDALEAAIAQDDGETVVSNVHTYALIDNRGADRAEALEVWTSEHDAGHPDVIAEAQRRVNEERWVSVDGPCKAGDTLDVSSDGDATVVE